MFSTNCAPFYSSESFKWKGLEKVEEIHEPNLRGGKALKVLRNRRWHFLLFWLSKMKTATTDPRDQELELGTACCGNSLFLGRGLLFLTSPFPPNLKGTPSPTLIRRSPSSFLHPIPVGPRPSDTPSSFSRGSPCLALFSKASGSYHCTRVSPEKLRQEPGKTCVPSGCWGSSGQTKHD